MEFHDEQSKTQVNKKLKGMFIVKVGTMLTAPMRKILESFIIPLKENTPKEILKNITVKWVRLQMNCQ